MNSTNFSNLSRKGLTLIEVVAGLALLATLVVSLLTARARYTRQYLAAERRLQAASVADALLTQWWRDPAKFPRNDTGLTPGTSPFHWRTRPLPTPQLDELDAEMIRLELSDPRPSRDAGPPVLGIDLLLPKEPPPLVLPTR